MLETDNINRQVISTLLDKLETIRAAVIDQAHSQLQKFTREFPDQHFSHGAVNLAHYLTLRRHDLTEIQQQLAELGLSSLGRIEAHVLPTLDQLIALLKIILGTNSSHEALLAFHTGYIANSDAILSRNSEQLFGPLVGLRQSRIMVTFATEAAADYKLVKSLMQAGMNCARINCAHDTREHWLAMIQHVRKAEQELNLHCPVVMDLAGHKMRTGEAETLPGLHHFKIPRNRYGHKIGAAEVLIEREDRISQMKDTGGLKRVGIPVSVFNQLQLGDRITFKDARGKKRQLDIIQHVASHWKAVCHKTTYLSDSTLCSLQRLDRKGQFKRLEQCHLRVPQEEQAKIQLFRDDLFKLVDEQQLSQPAEYDENDQLTAMAQVSCSLTALEQKLKQGDPVWIDDGKLGAVVDQMGEDGIILRVSDVPSEGVKIKPDKGINFPGVDLGLSCLSDKDREDLDFVCQHADIVGFSFVESAADMNTLRDQLAQRERADMPIIAKIETDKAVRNLPEIILSTIGQQPLGIMIARGDLAVELGNARLAEIQEELLWLCEAAHIPVIWATQVLETMAKKGVRSRPEFTDAAASIGAECVMLNKGPHIVDAITALDDVLLRMQAHHHKKFSRLRALHW